MAALSDQEQAFCEYYLIHWQGAKSARLAGYSEHTARQQASRMLKRKAIKAYIDKRLEELKITADEVLTRLTDHARGSMADFIKVDDKGKVKFDFREAQKADKLHLIKKFKIRTGDVMEFEVELYDAQSALVTLAKHHKLLTDKVQITTWEEDAIQDIQRGELPFEILAEEMGHDLATRLFQNAGVPVSREAGSGEAAE